MAENYSAINQSSVLCKIMESIIRVAIMNHMKIKNLFSLDSCQEDQRHFSY